MPVVRSFSMQMPKIIRKRKERNRRTERYSILHVQTAMKYLVTYSQCKIAKANCTNSASYDVKKKKEKKTEIVLLVRDSRTECLSFGLIFLHTEIL